MTAHTPLRILLLLVTAPLILAACDLGVALQLAPPTAVPSPTSAATLAPAPTAAASPTLALAPTPPTAAFPTAAPAVDEPAGGDLSEAEMLKIFQDSFAAYPWRWKQA